jgi:hypothetical protein
MVTITFFFFSTEEGDDNIVVIFFFSNTKKKALSVPLHYNTTREDGDGNLPSFQT